MSDRPPHNLRFFARAMRYSDLDSVARNEAAAAQHPWTRRNLIDCLKAGYQCRVLAGKGRIAAHGVMSVATGECHLLTLCVHPHWQRRGYGARMFNSLLERAASLGASRCLLEVRASNQAAVGFYRSLGFVPTGTRRGHYQHQADGREDMLIMSRAPDARRRENARTR